MNIECLKDGKYEYTYLGGGSEDVCVFTTMVDTLLDDMSGNK